MGKCVLFSAAYNRGNIRRNQYGDLLQDWYLKQKDKRTKDRRETHRHRRNQYVSSSWDRDALGANCICRIIERLEGLGYEHDLAQMNRELMLRFCCHPLVNQSRELTDRSKYSALLVGFAINVFIHHSVWKNIKEPMIAFAEEARTFRRMRKHGDHYENRLRAIRVLWDSWALGRSMLEAHPSPADLSWYMPGLDFIMSAPPEVRFSETAQPDLEIRIHNWAGTWQERVHKILYNKVPLEALVRIVSSMNSVACPPDFKHIENPTFNDLCGIYVASVWWRCKVKGCLVDTSRLFAHACTRSGPPVKLEPETDEDVLNNAYTCVFEEVPWNHTGDKFEYAMDAHRAAERVLTLAGYDANSCEGGDPDADQPRFVCGKCSAGGKVCVMPWRVAVRLVSSRCFYVSRAVLLTSCPSFVQVRHLCRPDHTGEEVPFALLHHSDKSRVMYQESKRTASALRNKWKLWGCKRCRHCSAMTRENIVAHCETMCVVLQHLQSRLTDRRGRHDVEKPSWPTDFDLHLDCDTPAKNIPAEEVFIPQQVLKHTTIPRIEQVKLPG